MSTMWKVLLGLVLALPLAAFVAGAVLASSTDEPAPRETIVIQDAPSRPDDDGPRSGPGRSDDESRPGQHPSGSGDDDSDDSDDSDDDEVEVVRPEPDTVDDDHSGPGGDDADDNSGPGGGSTGHDRDSNDTGGTNDGDGDADG
jgi:hypothetical protein